MYISFCQHGATSRPINVRKTLGNLASPFNYGVRETTENHPAYSNESPCINPPPGVHEKHNQLNEHPECRGCRNREIIIKPNENPEYFYFLEIRDLSLILSIRAGYNNHFPPGK